MVRSLSLFAPWHAQDATHRLAVDVPEPDVLHAKLLDYLRAGPAYAAAYRPAFYTAKHELISRLRVPATLTRWDGKPDLAEVDELIARVWKEPAFFLAHPLAIAAFGRECTRRGVPPAPISMFGSQFITWRGLPIVPCDKIGVEGGKSSILLLRTGESRQGVIGLYQPGLPGEQGMGLAVRFMGISRKAIASYLISLYCSLVVMTEDALGVLDNVDVTKYHEYDHKYAK
jgi:hypothetical protein